MDGFASVLRRFTAGDWPRAWPTRAVARLWPRALGSHARPGDRPASRGDDDGRDAVHRSGAVSRRALPLAFKSTGIAAADWRPQSFRHCRVQTTVTRGWLGFDAPARPQQFAVRSDTTFNSAFGPRQKALTRTSPSPQLT